MVYYQMSPQLLPHLKKIKHSKNANEHQTLGLIAYLAQKSNYILVILKVARKSASFCGEGHARR